MTSNQIANQANMEVSRHNKVYEAETERHNKRMEDLEADKNTIQLEWNRVQGELEQEKLRIQKEYNSWYSKWTEASGREKLRLEAEGNSIKQRMADIDESYKIRLNDLESARIGTITAANAETKRHNKQMEYLTSESTWNEMWWRGKDLEYKEHALDLSAQWKASEFQIARDRLEQEGVKITVDSLWHANQLAQQQQVIDSQLFKNYAEGIMTPFRVFTQGVGNLFSPIQLNIGGR